MPVTFVAAAFLGLFAACRAPLPNRPTSPIEMREVPRVQVDDAEREPPVEAVVAAQEPFFLDDDADSAWVQPIQFDPAGGWATSKKGSAVRSPLWLPGVPAADGSQPTPPGRQEQEQMAAALVLSLALIFTAHWTL